MSKTINTDPRPRPLLQEENVIKQQFVMQCLRLQNLVNLWLAGSELVSHNDVRAAFSATEAVNEALSSIAAVSAEDIDPDFSKAGEGFITNARGLVHHIPTHQFGVALYKQDVDYASICNYNMKMLQHLNQMFQTA